MFAHQYMNMCKEARDELEYVRVFKESEEELVKFNFKPGDFFHHYEMGEDEVREVLRVEKINIRAVDDSRPYRKDKCIWIPTADQLIEETRQIPFSILSKEDLKKYYEGHNLYYLSDEERVLAYFMEKRERKVWDFESQKWIKIDS